MKGCCAPTSLFCFHSLTTHTPQHSSCRVCLEKHNHKRRRRRANRNSGSGGGDGGDGAGGSGSGSGGPSHQGTPPPRRFKRSRAGDSDVDGALIRGAGATALADAGGIMVGVGVGVGEGGEGGTAVGAQADERLSARYVDQPPKRKADVKAEAMFKQTLDPDADEFEEEEPTPKRAKQEAATAVREESCDGDDDDDHTDADDHQPVATSDNGTNGSDHPSAADIYDVDNFDDLMASLQTPRGDGSTPRLAGTALQVTPRPAFAADVPPAHNCTLIRMEPVGVVAAGELYDWATAPAAECGLGCS